MFYPENPLKQTIYPLKTALEIFNRQNKFPPNLFFFSIRQNKFRQNASDLADEWIRQNFFP